MKINLQPKEVFELFNLLVRTYNFDDHVHACKDSPCLILNDVKNKLQSYIINALTEASKSLSDDTSSSENDLIKLNNNDVLFNAWEKGQIQKIDQLKISQNKERPMEQQARQRKDPPEPQVPNWKVR